MSDTIKTAETWLAAATTERVLVDRLRYIERSLRITLEALKEVERKADSAKNMVEPIG